MDERARGEERSGAGGIATSAYAKLCRAALEMVREHPEITERRDFLLTSINARLGALLDHFKALDPGADAVPLTDDWLGELALFAVERAKEAREALDNPHG